jgi:hypothetical protein
MRRGLLAGVLGLAAVACGGGGGAGSPAAPAPASPPAPILAAGTALSFVSGETDQPVGGARVTVGTASYLADGSGQILLGETVPQSTQMTILAEGYLDRRVLVGSPSETRFTLWPRLSTLTREPYTRYVRDPYGLDELWTQELAYTDTRYCSLRSQFPLAGRPLRRARSGAVIPVGIAEGQLKRPSVERAVQAATGLANAASEGRVVFQYVEGSVPGGGIVVESLDSPGDEATFIAQLVASTDAEGYVTGGRIQFSIDPVQRPDWPSFQQSAWFLGETEFLTETVAHELGHALGLWHAYFDADRQTYHWGLMTIRSDATCGGMGVWYYLDARDFSPAEKLALKLMYQRRPGNTFPDSDGGVRAAQAGETAVVCRLGAPPQD